MKGGNSYYHFLLVLNLTLYVCLTHHSPHITTPLTTSPPGDTDPLFLLFLQIFDHSADLLSYSERLSALCTASSGAWSSRSFSYPPPPPRRYWPSLPAGPLSYSVRSSVLCRASSGDRLAPCPTPPPPIAPQRRYWPSLPVVFAGLWSCSVH